LLGECEGQTTRHSE
jgi:hypothetical protein